MKACGIACDKESLSQFFKCMGDKSVTELIKEGQKNTVKMPQGGGGAAAAAAPAAAKAEEAPKEDEKKEEEADVDMGGLFGDDDEYS